MISIDLLGCHSSNGHYLGFGLSDGGVGVLELATFRAILKQPGAHGLAVTCVSFVDLPSSAAKASSEDVDAFLISGAPDGLCKFTHIAESGGNLSFIFLGSFFV